MQNGRQRLVAIGGLLLLAAVGLWAAGPALLQPKTRWQPTVRSFRPRAGAKHVLVTGGAGFIGSHAVLELVKEGHCVTIVDNLSRGNLGAVQVLQRQAQPDQIRFLNIDLADAPAVDQAFRQDPPVEVVIHFAGVAYVQESYENPLLYYHNITANTLQLLETMARHRVQRLIYSSTCATYGNAKEMPIVETTPQAPVSPYGESKLAAEKIILDFARSKPAHAIGFSFALLRYFNVIGSDPQGRIGEAPRRDVSERFGRISAACFDAATGRRKGLSVLGTSFPTKDGTAVRDYIHVVDLVQAHLQVMKALKTHDQRVYNVAVGNGYSVREFVEACRAVTGAAIPVTEGPARDGDAAMVYANPAKIKAELGWEPQFADLKVALKTAWDWHRSHPNGYAT